VPAAHAHTCSPTTRWVGYTCVWEYPCESRAGPSVSRLAPLHGLRARLVPRRQSLVPVQQGQRRAPRRSGCTRCSCTLCKHHVVRTLPSCTPAGVRQEYRRLFQLPMRLVATTMQAQHPTQPVVSPLQPRTPLASHIRKNRRRPVLRRNLNSVLAMSPGSPESPARSLSVGFTDSFSPVAISGATTGFPQGFR